MSLPQRTGASATKERILDAAETLFAEHSFDGTSLRSITGAAGVNLAAANYHFGSKEALLQAVLSRRLGPINRQRIDRLDVLEAEAGSRPLDVEAVLRAFLEPAFQEIHRLGGAGEKFVQLAGRIHSETDPGVRQMFMRLFAEVVARYFAALRQALPDCTPEELHWKFHFLIGAMADTLTWGRHDQCAQLIGEPPRPELALESLLAFCVAGLCAPRQQESDREGS